MKTGIDIRDRDLAIVRATLRKAGPETARVWVFGSRANGIARATSDLDLALDAGRALTLYETAALREAFENSDLPYTVDIVDLSTVPPGLRAEIEALPILLAPVGSADGDDIPAPGGK